MPSRVASVFTAAQVQERESFEPEKHLRKGMVVLLRTEEDAEDESGWHRPW